MKMEDIKELVKRVSKQMITNPFDTCLQVSMYVVAWAAGLWCIAAAITFAGKMLNFPALQML
tara:strand:- start:248 stop:433 length:186 start_codon:yes stop_codon:yes gene_type:complete